MQQLPLLEHDGLSLFFWLVCAWTGDVAGSSRVICVNERNASQRGSSHHSNNGERALDIIRRCTHYNAEKLGGLLMHLPSLITLSLYSMSLLVCSLQEVRFTLDRCAGAAVKEKEGLGSWLTTEDHSSCEVTGVTPNTDRYTWKPEHTLTHLYFC